MWWMIPGARDRHEILDFAHAVGAQEAGDQDVGVGEVELLARPPAASGCDPPEPAAGAVEDRREHARRVEIWAAVPVDRAIDADERGGVQVPDQTMLGDREVVIHGYLGAVVGTAEVRGATSLQTPTEQWRERQHKSARPSWGRQSRRRGQRSNLLSLPLTTS